MWFAKSLFDLDGLDFLIEESMPVLAIWLVALAVSLATVVISEGVDRIKHRSPVDKLLRRRFG